MFIIEVLKCTGVFNMIYEFVGFPAYEAAVESEIGLLGVLPVDAQ